MSVTTLSPRQINNLAVRQVDELGALNAQISLLNKQADVLKASLKASGFDEVVGKVYRAVISTKTTARLDTKLVKGLLTPRQIDDCTVEGTSTSISLYDL